MNKGQQLYTPEGVQVALFPMKTMTVTQRMGGSYSHADSKSIDIAGKDAGIEDAYASVDCEVRWIDTRSGHGLLFQSLCPVLCSDGDITPIHWTMWHDNYTGNIKIGQVFKQGDVIYQEGTAGNATGNHIHFSIAKGEYKKGYPLVKNDKNVWEIKNEFDPTKILFINDTIIRNDGGYDWKTYVPNEVVKPEPKPMIKEIKVGSKVKFKDRKLRYIYHTTKQPIPMFVKVRQHVIGQINKDRALLVNSVKNGRIVDRGVYSWVYLKDLELV